MIFISFKKIFILGTVYCLTMNSVHAIGIDHLKDAPSGITLQNTSGNSFTITGVFIQQLFQSNDCTTSYYDNHGVIYGEMWSTATPIPPSASTPLGASYLYSMMINYLFEASVAAGKTNSTPQNGGSGDGKWCVQLGVIQGGPANYASTVINTNTSPASALSNIITWTNNTSPVPIAITCSDATQTCTANVSATQNFPL